MSRRWPPPTYEMTCEEGPPHERQFTITCILLKLREVGTGKSKKAAKRLAANKMWERLQNNPDCGDLSLEVSTCYFRKQHFIYIDVDWQTLPHMPNGVWWQVIFNRLFLDKKMPFLVIHL